MTEWDDLLGHPAWRKLDALQRDRRTDLVARLIELGTTSTDAKVAAVARHIEAIDELLRLPEEEAQSERTGAGLIRD